MGSCWKERDKAVWRLQVLMRETEQFLNSLCGSFGGQTDEAASVYDLAQLGALCKSCFLFQENLQ